MKQEVFLKTWCEALSFIVLLGAAFGQFSPFDAEAVFRFRKRHFWTLGTLLGYFHVILITFENFLIDEMDLENTLQKRSRSLYIV